MEWTKIPTTLITKRFTDYELASIVKFQLVWAINEEQPDKQTCLRYMTSKQYETAMTYLDSVSATVGDEVSSIIRKRNAEKIRYNKNKDLSKNLQAECQQNVSSLSEQIRLDKIREDKKENILKEKSVLIEEGKFHIDDTMAEYKDLLTNMGNPDELCVRVWKWVMKNFEGREVKISFIRSMIEKFKNEGGKNGN